MINDDETEKYLSDMKGGRSPGPGNVLLELKLDGTGIRR